MDDKVLGAHVLKDFIVGLYNSGRSIAVALWHDAAAVISHVCEEGGVVFRVFFHSDVVVTIY